MSGHTATPATLSDHPSRLLDLFGPSASTQRTCEEVQQVATTNFTVIIQGETGTGKELVARLLHEQSQRAAKPFVAIDCGALPESLIENELFGCVSGAFTGAERKRIGYFELAKGGTLFLDEITHLSPSAQMKLLRCLQEGSIRRLGSGRQISTDVRIVVASNVSLTHAVDQGFFRADLYHRLAEFTLQLAPLRERREDVLFLADLFRREANTDLGRHIHGFSADAQAYLLTHAWPGNVRELRNTVRRAVLLSQDAITLRHIRQMPQPGSCPDAALSLAELSQHVPEGYGLSDVVRQATVWLEHAMITRTLRECGGNKRQAARRLKIGYKTLYRKLKALPSY